MGGDDNGPSYREVALSSALRRAVGTALFRFACQVVCLASVVTPRTHPLHHVCVQLREAMRGI